MGSAGVAFGERGSSFTGVSAEVARGWTETMFPWSAGTRSSSCTGVAGDGTVGSWDANSSMIFIRFLVALVPSESVSGGTSSLSMLWTNPLLTPGGLSGLGTGLFVAERFSFTIVLVANGGDSRSGVLGRC